MEIKVGQEPTQERAGGSVRRAKVLAILATEEKSTVNATHSPAGEKFFNVTWATT